MTHLGQEHAACCGHFQWWREAFFADRKPFAQPGSFKRYAPDMPVNVVHVKLAVTVTPEDKTLTGVVSTRFIAVENGLTDVFFEAREMEILGAKLVGSGDSLPIERSEHGFKVRLPKPLSRGSEAEVAVDYRVVRPKAGIYFTGPTGLYPDKPVQVWTQGQDEDACYWFPVAVADYPNHKMTSEVIATVPEHFVALSNGRLVVESADAAAKTKTFHWLHDRPHVSYLVTLVVGEFARVSEAYKDLPVECWANPARIEQARAYAKGTAELVGLFSGLYGVEYPWNGKYGQVLVQDFIFGGMENTTLSTITDRMLADETVSDEFRRFQIRLNAHELNHHWWGDLITCRDWSHAWLNEGGATYGEVEAMEHFFGKKERDYYVKTLADTYFAEDRRYRRPIVTNVYREPIDLFDRHLYQKGGLVRHMLRYLLGDTEYYRALKQFLTDYAYQPADTHDFIKSIEKATGRNLREFFDQWVFGAGFPEFRVGYVWDEKNKVATIKVAQTQKIEGETGLFSMPIRMSFTLADGSVVDYTLNVHEKEHSFSVAVASKPVMFRFDPENWVLKKLNLTAVPKAMLIHQLANDTEVMGRVHAAAALTELGGVDAVEALAASVRNSIHWGVQVECAAGLGKIATPAAREALKAAVKNADARVRRAVVNALGTFKDESVAELLAGLITGGGEASRFVLADAAVALGKTKSASALPALRKALEMPSWNETIRIGAINGLAELGSGDALELVAEHSTAGRPAAARPAAITAMGRLSKAVPKAVDLLHTLADSEETDQFTLRMALVGALGEAKKAESAGVLETIGKTATDGRIKRAVAETLAELKSARAATGSSDEIAARVEKLEAQLRAVNEKQEQAALATAGSVKKKPARRRTRKSGS